MVSSHDKGREWACCHCQDPGPDTDRSSENFSAGRQRQNKQTKYAVRNTKDVKRIVSLSKIRFKTELELINYEVKLGIRLK